MCFLAVMFWLIVLLIGGAIFIGGLSTLWFPALFIFKVRQNVTAILIATPITLLVYLGNIVGVYAYQTHPSVSQIATPLRRTRRGGCHRYNPTPSRIDIRRIR